MHNLSYENFTTNDNESSQRNLSKDKRNVDVALCRQMDDGFMEVYNALDNVSSQIDGFESSAVHRHIPYELFRQVIPPCHLECRRSWIV